MTYQEQFHKEYLLQQKFFDITQDCGVEHDDLRLLDEGETYWIVKLVADGRTPFVVVLWKQREGYIPHPMKITELVREAYLL